MIGSSKTQVRILKQSIKAARNLIDSLTVVQRTQPHKRFVLIILHDLVKKAEAVQILAEANHCQGMELIVRTAFENTLDIINVYQYPNEYPSYLLYNSILQQRKGLQAALDYPDSPFSKTLIDGAPKKLGMTVEEMKAQINSDLDEMRGSLNRRFMKGQREPSAPRAQVATRTEDKANWAGKSDQYNSIYRLYSRSAHSDIGPMFNAVFKGKELTWPPRDLPPSAMAIDLMTMFVLDSAKKVAKKQKRPVSRFNQIERERDDEVTKRFGGNSEYR